MSAETDRSAELVRRRPYKKCLVCGTFCEADEGSWTCEPFCWKCGTFLNREGNRWGWSAAEARGRADRFNDRIDLICRGNAPLHNDGSDHV